MEEVIFALILDIFGKGWFLLAFQTLMEYRKGDLALLISLYDQTCQEHPRADRRLITDDTAITKKMPSAFFLLSAM